jgi:hypothetical protein
MSGFANKGPQDFPPTSAYGTGPGLFDPVSRPSEVAAHIPPSPPAPAGRGPPPLS